MYRMIIVTALGNYAVEMVRERKNLPPTTL